MNELRRIVQAVDESPEDLYLATVVDVVGSAYRRPTARMLIRPNQEHIGSISGGCLERDVCRAAPHLTEFGPRVISFDTRQGSTDLNPRHNQGCEGIIYVLLERVSATESCPIDAIRQALESKTPVVSATVYQTDSGEFGSVGNRVTIEQLPHDSRLREIWQQTMTDGHPVCCKVSSNKSTRLLIERIDPPKPLWVFGAGFDARPLAAAGHQLGWDVTVIDHRAQLLAIRDFPNARRLMAQPNDVARQLDATPQTAAVLMTHSLENDKMLLPWLIQSKAGYVGILGPKSRTGRLLKDLFVSGKISSNQTIDRLSRLRTPIGLDIGGSNPAEIAVAIVAEIIANDNQRSGRMLLNQKTPIHAPVSREEVELRTNKLTSTDTKTSR